MPLEDRRPVKFKHRILASIYPHQGAAATLLKVLHGWVRLAHIPGNGSKLHPLMKPKNNWFMNMPANVEIAATRNDLEPAKTPGPSQSKTIPMDANLDTETVVMPIDVIHRLIDVSNYIHVMNQCVCRTGGNCQQHRHDIGCMFLGASGLDVVPPLSRPVTKEEAYAHVDAAIADGLVPQTMRIRADNYAFMFPDHHTVIAICFCCDCCCYTGFYRDAPRAMVDRVYHRPSGTRVQFDPATCRSCEERACISHCYMKALSVAPDGSITVSNDCRTCGRCAHVCPNGSAHLVASDPHAYAKALAELESLADLQGLGTGKKPLPQ